MKWRMVERTYPFAGAVVAGFASYQWGTPTLYQGAARSLGEVVGASSIIVGFLATSMAIMMSLGSSSLVKKLKEIGSYNRILGYLWGTTMSALVLVGYSIMLRFFHGAEWFAGQYQHIAVSIWLAVAALVFLSSYRSIHIMYVLLQHIGDD